MNDFVIITAAMFLVFEIWKIFNVKYISYCQIYLVNNKENFMDDYSDSKNGNHEYAKSCINFSLLSIVYIIWTLVLLCMGFYILGIGLIILSFISHLITRKVSTFFWSYIQIADSVFSIILIGYTVFYPLLTNQVLIR